MESEISITTQKEVGGRVSDNSPSISNMPWDAEGFKKHNKKLSGAKLQVAAKVATAMVKKGEPEGKAIATGNKVGKNYKAKSDKSDKSVKA